MKFLKRTGMEPFKLMTGKGIMKHILSLIVLHAMAARGSKVAGFVSPASFPHARGLQRLWNVGVRTQPSVRSKVFMVETSETRDATIGDFKTRWTRTMRERKSKTIDVAAHRDTQHDSADLGYSGPRRTYLSAFADDQDQDTESEQEADIQSPRSRVSYSTGSERDNSIKDHIVPQAPSSILSLNPSYINDLPQAPIGGISRTGGATVPLRLKDDPASQEDKVRPSFPHPYEPA
jgi:hypothetical protein